MSGALDGLRVVDISHYLAGPLVAMVLGDLGADVVRIDPPGGPRWKHPANAVLQRGKRSIVLDLHDDADRSVAQRLAAQADVLVENFRPGVAARLGLGWPQLHTANPSLVYCSLPGFAADDSRAGLPGWEGVVTAAAGLFPPQTYGPPGERRFTALPMLSSFAAVSALHAVLAALIGRERDGVGQRVEAALFDAAFEIIGGGGQKVGDAAPMPQGVPAPQDTTPQIGHYQGADGRWIQLCLIQPSHLAWFATTFLTAEQVAAGMGESPRIGASPELQQQLRAVLIELIATRPAADWEQVINEESHAPTGLCQTTEHWLRADSHARDSGAVLELPGDPEYGDTIQAGSPILLAATPPRPHGPRHELDADRDAVLAELANLEAAALERRAPEAMTTAAAAEPAESAPPARRLPLAGMRVVDVSQVLAAPTTGRILAEYGAEVVKINSLKDRQHFMHIYTNSGKRTMLLDLKSQRGLQVFRALTEGVDVFIENFTRGVADRIGIGYQDLRASSPDVVYTTVSAFGHNGYRGGWRGREELGQAITGLQMRWFGSERPRMLMFALNDYGAGNWGAVATLAALLHRLRGGTGQQVHASLSHTATFHQLPFMIAYEGRVWDEPAGEDARGWSATDRMFRAADRWLYVAAVDDADRHALLQVLGAQGEATSGPTSGLAARADEQALITALEHRFAERDAESWARDLVAAGVAAHVVRTQEEVLDDPMIAARGLSLHRTLPTGESLRTVGPGRRLSATPLVALPIPGAPGTDTAAVLAELGMRAEIDALVEQQVVALGLPEGVTFYGRFQPGGPPTPKNSTGAAGTESNQSREPAPAG